MPPVSLTIGISFPWWTKPYLSIMTVLVVLGLTTPKKVAARLVKYAIYTKVV